MSSSEGYFSKMKGQASAPARPKLMIALLSGLGGALAIATVAYLTEFSDALFLMAPFGASCFLAFAVPDAPLAQPRNIILGHLISTAIGLLILTFAGSGEWQMAVGVGLAIAAMMLARAGHPPAGADPIVVLSMSAMPGWDFLLFPVLSGSVVIVLVALFYNNLRKGVSYPKYWF